MSGLSNLTHEQREAVKASVCPGCLYRLPEVFYMGSDRPGFTEHSLPGTEFRMRCMADGFRRAVYEASLVEEPAPAA